MTQTVELQMAFSWELLTLLREWQNILARRDTNYQAEWDIGSISFTGRNKTKTIQQLGCKCKNF